MAGSSKQGQREDRGHAESTTSPSTVHGRPSRSQWSPPADSKFYEPATRLTGEDLFYCSALAWICTCDAEVTTALQAALTAAVPSMRDALRLLDESLADVGSSRLLASKDGAARQLFEAVSCGSVVARAAGVKHRKDIGHIAWMMSEVSDATRHDELVEMGETGVTHREVRFDEKQVLARWTLPPDRLLYRLGGATWSLGATVYWVKHGDHRGYRPGVRFLAWSDAMAWIREKLRAGSLSCEAAVRADVPGIDPSQMSLRPREPDFWAGHGLGDLASARFQVEQVLKTWKPHPIEAIRGLSMGDAIKILMAPPYEMGREEARSFARQHAEDRRGKTPRRKNPKSLGSSEAK